MLGPDEIDLGLIGVGERERDGQKTPNAQQSPINRVSFFTSYHLFYLPCLNWEDTMLYNFTSKLTWVRDYKIWNSFW